MDPGPQRTVIFVTQYIKRDILSSFEKIEIFTLYNRRFLNQSFQWYQKVLQEFPFIFFKFYTLFCSLSQNKPGRQDVPFVVLGHILPKMHLKAFFHNIRIQLYRFYWPVCLNESLSDWFVKKRLPGIGWRWRKWCTGCSKNVHSNVNWPSKETVHLWFECKCSVP